MGEGTHQVINWRCAQNFFQHKQNDMEDGLHSLLKTAGV